MNLFYDPSLQPKLVSSLISLDLEESNHCARVLRMRVSDSIHLTDGRGNLYTGTLLSVDPKKCQLQIMEVRTGPETASKLHIAIAPTKSMDRLEWFLEKATEIGIHEITPVVCEHSERTVVRRDRLQKILVSAMKQSMNLCLPKLNEPVAFNSLIHCNDCVQKYIAYVEEKQEIHLKQALKPAEDALILIGPEGDFSKEEVENAQSAGFLAVSLGDSRLRTETAGVVACMVFNLVNF